MESNKPSLPGQDPTEPVSPRETEPQPAEDLDELQTRIRGYSDRKWALILRIGGALLGAICGLMLTYFSNFESIGMFSTIGAVLIALLLPNVIEKRVKRSVQKGRTAMLIALAAWLVLFTLIMVLMGVPIIQPK
ncbi:MAG: hypothetical protein LLF75_02965 [Eubacteriales bacterium]|nr:hypothetical protein [Eubacteriales bacterium]